MKKLFKHLRTNIFRGLLAIIPLFLSFLAIRLLYVLIDRRVMAFLDRFIEVRQVPGMGLLLVLVCLYLIGLIVGNIIGKQFFHLLERTARRIPIVNAIYQVGKQLSQSLSDVGGKQTFQKALLVKWNSEGSWVIAFVAGRIKDQQTGESLLRVFMPHAPNPTSGFVFLVKESQTIDPGWTMEEAIKMVISGAVIAPDQINRRNNQGEPT